MLFSKKNIIPILVAGIFVCLIQIVMNVTLYVKLLSNYRELQRVNLDPGSQWLFHPVQRNDTAASGKVKVLMFGDSRISRWMPLPLQEEIVILKCGVSGDSTARAVLRLDRDVVGLSPDIVIIQLGVNDLKAIGVFPDQESQIIEQCKANIKKITDKLSQAGIHSIILTVFPGGQVEWYRRPVWSERIEVSITQLNDWIRTLQNENVTVIDCDSILKNAYGVRTELMTDCLHLNEQGYQHLNALIQSAIAEAVTKIAHQESK